MAELKLDVLAANTHLRNVIRYVAPKFRVQRVTVVRGMPECTRGGVY